VKIRVLPVVFTLAMTAAGAVRADEVVATSSLFKATQSGGFSYHLEALYSGCIDASEWEGAAGSKSVHANDELWCHWKVQSRITGRFSLFVSPESNERLILCRQRTCGIPRRFTAKDAQVKAAARQPVVSKVIMPTP
jgi:hypothetical protein